MLKTSEGGPKQCLLSGDSHPFAVEALPGDSLEFYGEGSTGGDEEIRFC